MIDQTELEEFEQRRQAAWKSAFQGAGDAGGEYPVKKKKKLTPAERQQQIKGLSKAFVNPGAGWAKVDPVLVVDDDDDDDDYSDHGNDNHPNHDTMVAAIQADHGAINSTTVQSQTTESFQEKAETVVATANKPSLPRDSQQQIDVRVLDRLLQMVRTHGPEVALSWAEEHVKQGDVANSSNQAKNTPPPVPLSSSFLPIPVRLLPFNTPQAVDQERNHYAYFREAAQHTPYEYTTSSSNVMFVIRRPYGYESRPGLFERMSAQAKDLYKRKAHLSTFKTLEVAVVLKPNLPVLLLYDDEKVMYRLSPTQQKFQAGNLKMRLGTITYPSGSDPAEPPVVYSLETLAQQALSLRQQYAVTVTATAMSLFKTKSINDSSINMSAASFDVGVDTSDLVTVTRKTVATNTVPTTNSNTRVQHFSWWIRKKLPTMLWRRSGKWTTLLFLIILSGALYVFFFSQFVIHDPLTARTRQAENRD